MFPYLALFFQVLMSLTWQSVPESAGGPLLQSDSVLSGPSFLLSPKPPFWFSVPKTVECIITTTDNPFCYIQIQMKFYFQKTFSLIDRWKVFKLEIECLTPDQYTYPLDSAQPSLLASSYLPYSKVRKDFLWQLLYNINL